MKLAREEKKDAREEREPMEPENNQTKTESVKGKTTREKEKSMGKQRQGEVNQNFFLITINLLSILGEGNLAKRTS